MSSIDWFDELEMDPLVHPVAMGTRALGDRPWLIVDDKREAELALKQALLETHRDAVLFETEASGTALGALSDMLGTDAGDLASIACAVQEDLCLLQRRDDGWYLDASCVCFPTRWHLRDKVGQHIAQVHAPVDGYDPRITGRVDRLFDGLGDHTVWRRNWFLMTDPTLYQPDRPEHETIIATERARTDLYIRSERQTLRVVIPGWILFTIRIQQEPLGELVDTAHRRAAFTTWLKHVSDDFGARRHLTPAQRQELLRPI